MRKFLILLVLMGILTACSKDVTQENEDVESEQNETTNPSEGIDQEDPVVEDEPTEEPKEEPEEVPILDPEPEYYVNSANWTIKPIDSAKEQVALLTIDDAPDEHAVEMAQLLKQLGVQAIFFVNGHFVDTPEEQEKLKAIHELGFAIGNHTYNHSLLSDISEQEQREEIIKLNQLIEEIIGEKPKFFRAPHGVNTDISHQVAKEEGMIVMNWTYGYDWVDGYLNKEALADIMVNSPYLNDGANLLMHDRSWTFEALEEIVNGLRNKGYEFVNPGLITSDEALN